MCGVMPTPPPPILACTFRVLVVYSHVIPLRRMADIISQEYGDFQAVLWCFLK